uniref:Uncharacterized protein n=1 Tax=Anguilla anguilla TaxID=7936 RepID=A0A0E9P992_ANGAN
MDAYMTCTHTHTHTLCSAKSQNPDLIKTHASNEHMLEY